MPPTALSSTVLEERTARGFLCLNGWAFLEYSFVGVVGAWAMVAFSVVATTVCRFAIRAD